MSKQPPTKSVASRQLTETIAATYQSLSIRERVNGQGTCFLAVTDTQQGSETKDKPSLQ